MIDVHSHIVFGVDDGAKNLEQSIEMLKEAKNVGFEKVILTPHYMEGYYEENVSTIAERIVQIEKELQRQNIDIKVVQGNEIYITTNINDLIEQKIAMPLANSRYVLFELPMVVAQCLILEEVVYKILQAGRIPVIAHPERYSFVQKDVSVLNHLIEDGVLMQSNYASIVGNYGKQAKETVKYMLRHNMVHLLGSDVHRTKSIYPKIPKIKNELEKIIGKEKLKILTTINPKKLIENEEILIELPSKEQKGFFTKLFKVKG